MVVSMSVPARRTGAASSPRSGTGVGRRAAFGRRARLLVLPLVLLVSGCSVATQAGAAAVVGGTAISESQVHNQSLAFLGEQSAGSPGAQPTDAVLAEINRAQVTFQVRHALITKAAQVNGITPTAEELTTAQTGLDGQKVAAALSLPASDGPQLAYDFVVIGALAKKLPQAGVQVPDVSVSVEGVPAADRSEAVAKRSQFLSDPAVFDREVAAAPTGGVARTPITLLGNPGVGSTGVFSAGNGQLLILPGQDAGYLVLQVSDRKLGTGTLTAATLGAAQSAADYFDLGALLLAPSHVSETVTVNPRYGVWDPVSVRAVPGNDGL